MAKVKRTANPEPLPLEGFVRLSQILQVIPVGKTTWWDGVNKGRFPKPVPDFGPRTTVWRVEDIRKLIENPCCFARKHNSTGLEA